MAKETPEKRTEFKLWMDWRETIDMMTMEERGLFLTMLYDSYEYKSIQPIPEDSKVLKVAWSTMKGLVKRAIKDYDLRKGWVKSMDYIDTTLIQSMDSPKVVLVQDSTTITNTTTSTGTPTSTGTTTSKNKTKVKVKEKVNPYKVKVDMDYFNQSIGSI